MGEITVNGVNLVYDVRGLDGPPVLLICGTGQPAASWEMFGRPTLDAAGFRTITFDNRGMPPSDSPPGPYRVEDMAEDAIGLMEHLGLAPYHVAGASLGALIAQTVALRRPDLVRSAALVVGGGNFCLAANIRTKATVAVLRAGGPAADIAYQAGMLDAMLTPAQQRDDAAVQFALDMVEGLFGSWGEPGRLAQMEADVTWGQDDHLEELAGMRVPCLISANEHDCYFPPTFLRQAADRIPDCEYLEVPDAAHVPLDPAALAKVGDAMVDFFTRH
jgi:pimeloyl-ACP methyl ester carboxylesterase